MSKLTPIHPGEIIKEEVLIPLSMTVRQLARELNVTPVRLNDIVLGRRGVTADTALRLSRFLGTTAEFWMGLQSDYELRLARQANEKQIAREVKPKPAA